MEGLPQGTQSDGLAPVEEFCVFSVQQLLALRPARRLNDGFDFGLRLEDVPPDAAAPFSQQRGGARAAKPKARGPIGPITECVPVQAEVLRRCKGELRRIEALTGAQIREKAGLRNYTVMVTGTTSIVEQALPLVERALLEEEDASPEALTRGLPPAEPPPPEPAGLPEPPAEPSLPSRPLPPEPIVGPPAGLGSPSGARPAWQNHPLWPQPPVEEPRDAPPPPSQGELGEWRRAGWWDPIGRRVEVEEEEPPALKAPGDGHVTPGSAEALPGNLQHHGAQLPSASSMDGLEEASPAVDVAGDATPTDLPPAVVPEALFPGRWRQNKASSPVELQQLGPQSPLQAQERSPTTVESKTSPRVAPPQAPLPPEPPQQPVMQAVAPPALPLRLPEAPQALPPPPPVPESVEHEAPLTPEPPQQPVWQAAAPPALPLRLPEAPQALPPPPPVPESVEHEQRAAAAPTGDQPLLVPTAEAPGLERAPCNTAQGAEQDLPPPDTPDGAEPEKKKRAKKKKKSKKGEEPVEPVQEVNAAAKTSKAGKTLQNHFSKTAFSGLVDSSESGSDVGGQAASPVVQPKGKSKASGQAAPKASQKARKGARPQDGPSPAAAAAKSLDRSSPTAESSEPPPPATSKHSATSFDRRPSEQQQIPKPPPPMIPSAGPGWAQSGNRSPPSGNRSPPAAQPAQGREVASHGAPRSSPWFPVEASTGSPAVTAEQAAAGTVTRGKAPPPGVAFADHAAVGGVTRSKAPPPGVLAMEQAAAGTVTWGKGPPVDLAAAGTATRGKGPPPGASGVDHGVAGPVTKGKGPPPGVPGVDQALTRGKGPPPVVLAAQAKPAPPPPKPEPKVSNPLPRQPVVAGPPAAARVAPRVEKMAVPAATPSYYEEEEDPELACYLWDRRAQRPKNARPAPPAPFAGGGQQRAAPPIAIRSPPPKGGGGASHASPQQQRALLGQVIDMGFDEPSAKRALNATGWSGVEQAVTLLLGS